MRWLLAWPLMAGCCVPMGETWRPAVAATATGAPDRVLACTWSDWIPVTEGCADLADATARPDGAWDLPWYGHPYFTVILGEAPLMNTVYVACTGARVTGQAMSPWEQPLSSVTITDGDLRGGDWGGIDPNAVDAMAVRLCAGERAVRQ